MKRSAWGCLLALGWTLSWGASPAPADHPDPSLDAVLASDARLETVFQGDTFFEGPTWIPNRGAGYLIFSDVPGNVLNRLDSDGHVSVFLKDIFTGKHASEIYQSLGPDKVRMPGANGTTLDAEGRVVYASYSDGQIVRLEADGRRTVLASRFGDYRLNAPNDLVYGSDGTLYFTDSRLGTQRADGAGIPYEGVYALKDGAVRLLSKTIDHPNGVALSPDGRYLYVTNSRKKNVLRFTVGPNGISNESVFVDMSGDAREGVPDGIKTDAKGNVYSTGPGGVWILAPDGAHLGTIEMPRSVTNVAFGSADLKTLFITGTGAVYRIRLKKGGSVAPLKILASHAVEGAVNELASFFEKRVAGPVETDFAVTASILDRLARGESPDMVILSQQAVQQLVQKGLVRSQADLAASFVGVAVADDAPAPVLKTTQDFAAFLRSTPSLTTIAWYHADERGSIVAKSAPAGGPAGAVKYSIDGDATLPALSSWGTFGYTGQVYLSELQLYYYKARMYSPKLGRFMQPDPIAYEGGMNLYGYVNGDPVNLTDPFGLDACDDQAGGCPQVVIQTCGWFCTIGLWIPPVEFVGNPLVGEMAGGAGGSNVSGSCGPSRPEGPAIEDADMLGFGFADVSLKTTELIAERMKQLPNYMTYADARRITGGVDLNAPKALGKAVTGVGLGIAGYNAIYGDTQYDRNLARQDVAVMAFGEAFPALAPLTALPYSAGRLYADGREMLRKLQAQQRAVHLLYAAAGCP